MNGLLASLRIPFALRAPWATAAVATTPAPVRAADAVVHAPDAFRTPRRPEAAPKGAGPLEAPVLDRPAEVAPPAAGAIAPEPVAPRPVEPSVRVSAAHLVDPVGLRVVPFRPTTRWPLRRAAPRIYDPFRGFPLRSVHLADLMDGRTGRR